jgi:hypothetical protein
MRRTRLGNFRRNAQIGRAHPLEKRRLFLFEAVGIGGGGMQALLGDGDRRIEDQRQVGLQVAEHPPRQRWSLFPIKAAPSSLVGEGGIDETVADHPIAAIKCRFNDLRDMLAPCREHQQRFGFQMHGFGQQQAAQLFAQAEYRPVPAWRPRYFPCRRR